MMMQQDQVAQEATIPHHPDTKRSRQGREVRMALVSLSQDVARRICQFLGKETWLLAMASKAAASWVIHQQSHLHIRSFESLILRDLVGPEGEACTMSEER